MACGDFEDLARTASDKALRDNAFNFQNMMDIKEVLLLWFIYFFFDKKSAGSGATTLKNLVLIMKLSKIWNSLKNYTNLLLKY